MSAVVRAAVAPMALVAVAAVSAGCGTATLRTIRPTARTAQRATYPPVVIGAARCPRRQPPGVPASGEQSARQELAPPGITMVELCRYGPIGATGSRLQVRRTLRSPSAIDALQKSLNALPPPPTGPINCPSDDGAAIWLGLAYGAHAEVIESVQLQGCRDVSDGSIVGTASGYGEPHDRPPPLAKELIGLIPLHRRRPTCVNRTRAQCH